MSKLIKSSFTKTLTKESIVEIKSSLPQTDTSISPNFKEEEKEQEIKEDVIYYLSDAKREAQKVIDEANRYKEQVALEMEEAKSNALAKANLQYETSKKQGFEDGYSKGKEEGFSSCKEEIQRARSIVTLAQNEYEKTLENAYPQILEIGLTVAKKIIGVELEENEVWKNIVSNAIEEVKEQDEIIICVHPNRYEETLRHKEELEKMTAHTHKMMIYPDITLPSNGCTIETPYGKMEAGVGSQLKELKEQLLELERQGECNGSQSHPE
ncbi:flagellar assembly protein FliH [Alteribacter aurantiacus]|uniref:flagellar assembly protein FliH n=1 Tax=Alteribacter aurantiacus TaxID=254410 RepID=UPI00040468D4|nr:flagellar assembly protein FliH [Alteribacter aurantiacus]